MTCGNLHRKTCVVDLNFNPCVVVLALSCFHSLVVTLKKTLRLQLLFVLYCIAATTSHCMSYCSLFRRRFDLQNPSRMDRNVEMFLNVEKNLVQVQLIPLLL